MFSRLPFYWHVLTHHTFINPCRVDSAVGDVLEKIFPTECWCCSALRGVLYGACFGVIVGMVFAFALTSH
jgi:hypothetical protein